MYYTKIRKMDISNGVGVRTTLFVSGCTFDCEGCFNKEAQNFTNGQLWTEDVESQFIEYTKNPNVVGVNLLGGEIMQQDSAIILHLVKRIKEETGKSIWMWTGYTLDALYNMPDKMEILQYVDVLIDGRFEMDKKDLTLKYRGSANQRVIDIQKTLGEGRIVSFE